LVMASVVWLLMPRSTRESACPYVLYKSGTYIIILSMYLHHSSRYFEVHACSVQ
jgi:cytochrome P450